MAIKFYYGTKEQFDKSTISKTADPCLVYMNIKDEHIYFVSEQGQLLENSFENFVQEGKTKINSKNDLFSIALDSCKRLEKITNLYCGDTV